MLINPEIYVYAAIASLECRSESEEKMTGGLFVNRLEFKYLERIVTNKF
jgi:hypothetical protein